MTFNPKQEGSIEENFTLACDNLTSSDYTLKGIANVIELEVIGLDNKQIHNASKMKTIFFEEGLINKTVSRTLSVKNLTSVNVNYHWDIYGQPESEFQVDT